MQEEEDMTSEESGHAPHRGKGMNGGEHPSETAATGGASSAMSGAAQTARDMAGQAASMAGEVANRMPAATATAQQAIGVAQRQIESSSDEMLTAGTMFSLGIALGLLLAGSSRLLVAVALIPAAAMGATLIDRRTTNRP
jgi:hypothetical protein